MKKIMIAAFAVFSITFASCTGRGAAVDTDTVVVDSIEASVDTVPADTLVVVAGSIAE